MRTNKELQTEKLEALKRELAIGIEQLERGECHEFDSVEELLSHIKTDAHKRIKQNQKNCDKG
jgi:CTP:phosphocholine cytidylyltransferase-like protein